MLNRMREARGEIKPYISSFLDKKMSEYASVNQWSRDLFDRLDQFMNRAKMLRGGMVLVGHDILNGQQRDSALMAASALELVHSAFLIHDDIMDRDSLRRGEKTIYFQYEELGRDRTFKHPDAFGQSMGICAGDEAFFLAYELLISLPAPADMVRQILMRFTHEMKRVGLAQMGDVVFGHTTENPDENEILQVYRFKTAYYTFSLPLYMAAVLGGCDTSDAEILEEIGEGLGIIFQLKDDDLGIFGEEDTIGKPSGSDIREDKKTLFRHYLMDTAQGADLERLKNIFGQETISSRDIEYVRKLSLDLGVRAKIEKLMLNYAEHTKSKADSLMSAAALKPLILELLEYSLVRTY